MSENKKILLIGSGGHCLSVLDSLLASLEYDEIGIVGKEIEQSQESKLASMGVSLVGTDEDLTRLYAEGYTDAFIAIGSVGDVTLRKKLFQLIKNVGFHIPNIIDETSVVSQYAKLGEGIYVGKNAVINTCATIGDCVIVNTASIVEHECSIGEFVHIAPGAILSGNVRVGTESHIGAGSMVRQGVRIGSNTMIGMGSVVINDMGDRITAFGNPCKEGVHGGEI